MDAEDLDTAQQAAPPQEIERPEADLAAQQAAPPQAPEAVGTEASGDAESPGIVETINAALSAQAIPVGDNSAAQMSMDASRLAAERDSAELVRATLEREEIGKAFAAELDEVVEGWDAADALRSGQKLGAQDVGDRIDLGPVEPRVVAAQEQALLHAMKTQRIQQALDRLADMSPELRNLVVNSERTFGAANLTLADWAAENSAQLVDLYQTWSTGVVDGSIKSPTFEQFLDVRMREFRGQEGETRLAFALGQETMMIQSPGGISEPGIDLITYRDGRVELRDNKAIGQGETVRKVSALEWNLPKNLAEATEVVRAYVREGADDLPTVLVREVLPRLEGATQAIAAHAEGLSKLELRSAAVQREFAAILDQHGIDRVVDLESAAQDARISQRLRDRGFRPG